MLFPKVLIPSTLRNPPGQSPSLPVSTLRVYSASPQSRDSGVPPAARHALGRQQQVDVEHDAFLAELVPYPTQSPVSRGRVQKSPPYVAGTSTGCAAAGGAAPIQARPSRAAATKRTPSWHTRGSSTIALRDGA